MYADYVSQVFQHTPRATQVGLYPLWVGSLTAQPNYHCEPRVLDNYYLIVVRSGSGRFQSLGKGYTLKPGSAFFLFPGIMHSYQTDRTNPLRLAWIGFDGFQSAHILETLEIDPNRPMLKVHPSQADKIDSLMESILRHKHEDGTQLVVSGLLFQLFGHLARNQIIVKKKTSHQLASSTTLEHIPLDKPVERALAYMDSNFTTRIQIDQLACMVNMSRSAFSKRFKRETGYTPLSHIARLRLVQARYLLGTDMRIKDIARNTGFEDEFYFSRWFSKTEGITPTRFRAMLQSHKSGLSKIHKAPI